LKGYSADEIVGTHFSAARPLDVLGEVFYPAENRASGDRERELAIAVADGDFEEKAGAFDLIHDVLGDVVITALRSDVTGPGEAE